MAAVVVANVQNDYFGGRRVIFADLTTVADGNTWVTGLQKVDSVRFTPQTAVATGATVSGGTITFKVAAGTLAGQVVVIGT